MKARGSYIRQRWGALAVYALLGVVPHFDTAWAQSARNLGMGGVLVPDDTASLHNPAYAAPDFGEATVLPLPLGIISASPYSTSVMESRCLGYSSRERTPEA